MSLPAPFSATTSTTRSALLTLRIYNFQNRGGGSTCNEFYNSATTLKVPSIRFPHTASPFTTCGMILPLFMWLQIFPPSISNQNLPYAARGRLECTNRDEGQGGIFRNVSIVWKALSTDHSPLLRCPIQISSSQAWTQMRNCTMSFRRSLVPTQWLVVESGFSPSAVRSENKITLCICYLHFPTTCDSPLHLLSLRLKCGRTRREENHYAPSVVE